MDAYKTENSSKNVDDLLSDDIEMESPMPSELENEAALSMLAEQEGHDDVQAFGAEFEDFTQQVPDSEDSWDIDLQLKNNPDEDSNSESADFNANQSKQKSDLDEIQEVLNLEPMDSNSNSLMGEDLMAFDMTESLDLDQAADLEFAPELAMLSDESSSEVELESLLESSGQESATEISIPSEEDSEINKIFPEMSELMSQDAQTSEVANPFEAERSEELELLPELDITTDSEEASDIERLSLEDTATEDLAPELADFSQYEQNENEITAESENAQTLDNANPFGAELSEELELSQELDIASEGETAQIPDIANPFDTDLSQELELSPELNISPESKESSDLESISLEEMVPEEKIPALAELSQDDNEATINLLNKLEIQRKKFESPSIESDPETDASSHAEEIPSELTLNEELEETAVSALSSMEEEVSPEETTGLNDLLAEEESPEINTLDSETQGEPIESPDLMMELGEEAKPDITSELELSDELAGQSVPEAEAESEEISTSNISKEEFTADLEMLSNLENDADLENISISEVMPEGSEDSGLEVIEGLDTPSDMEEPGEMTDLLESGMSKVSAEDVGIEESINIEEVATSDASLLEESEAVLHEEAEAPASFEGNELDNDFLAAEEAKNSLIENPNPFAMEDGVQIEAEETSELIERSDAMNEVASEEALMDTPEESFSSEMLAAESIIADSQESNHVLEQDNSEVEALKAQSAKQEELIEQLESEIETLKANYQQSQSATEQMIQPEDHQSLQNEVQQLTTQIQDWEERYNNLSEKLDQQASLANKTDNLIDPAAHASLNQQVQEYRDQVQTLESEKSDLEKTVQQLQTQGSNKIDRVEYEAVLEQLQQLKAKNARSLWSKFMDWFKGN